MGTKKIRLNAKRLFSEEFKKSRVKEYESGEFTVAELGRLFDILRIVEMEKSSTKKVKDLEKRIKELERVIGQKQLNIDYLEKLIEIADEEFDIDIRKKQNTPQSGGLEKTGKK